MDFRIQETVDRLAKSLGLKNGNFDRISIPGGAGSLGQLIEDLHLSHKLHNACNMILTVHEDCGAGKTRADLEQAIRDARQIFPDCRIDGYFIYLDGQWDEVEPKK